MSATTVIQGNGPPTPWSGYPVVSTNSFQIGVMDTNGFGAISTYTVGNDMAKCGDNGEK